MMQYEFKASDAEAFANFLGVHARRMNGNLQFKRCPYCNSMKDEYTFGISLSTGQFNCLRSSCGAKGTFFQLAREFDFKLSTELEEYYRPKRKYRSLPQPKEPIVPKLPAIEYLEKRGISEQVAKRYEITVREDMPNVLVFPFYDEHNKLQFVKYRKADFDKEKDKAKEWCEPNCKPILFGIKQCDTANRTLTVTEGQWDSLSVVEAGIENAVSVPLGCNGFTWIPYCWDFVSQFKKIIIFGDHEKGKITLLDDFAQRWSDKVFHVREQDYLDCKDANEILLKYGKEQIRKCINNAVKLPVSRVIELADVETVDISKIEKLRTGVNQLDKLLYGGIPFGGVCLISGKAGQGKSTLASQIMAYALDNGYTCFAYSGELPNYMFKSWFDMQLAGDMHMATYHDDYTDTDRYQIRDTCKPLISEWYREKFYLYDNTHINGDEKESLVSTTEKVILQYGARVVLIDNLMTAIDLEATYGSDFYNRQSQFVKKLARLALKHNVLILLVAHKRKNNMSANGNDEVAGSSDISNLATINISYDRPDNDDGSDKRLIRVLKNRLFGKLETKGFEMSYSEVSKRIFGEGDDPYHEFGWNSYGIDANVAEETPFD